MGTSRGAALRLFDAHCHLQDPRILPALPHLLRSSLASGVRLFAVNGTSQVVSPTFFLSACYAPHPRRSYIGQLLCVATERLAYCQAIGGRPSFHRPLLRPSSLVSLCLMPFFFSFDEVGGAFVNRFVDERSPDWFSVMKELLHATPSAAIGEVSLNFCYPSICFLW